MTAGLISPPFELPSGNQRKRRLEHHFAENFASLAYPLLAECYILEGDMERARKVCRIGLSRHPRHPPGLFLLATVALRGGRMEEAEELLLQTLAGDSYHVEAAELLVAVQERLHRKRSALELAYQGLLRANPLSRGARARLRRIQAEQEMVKEVEAKLRDGDGSSTNGEQGAAPEAELPPAQPPPGPQPPEPPPSHVPEESPPPPAVKASPAPDIEDVASLTWEANIKKLAAMVSITSAQREELERSPWSVDQKTTVAPETPTATDVVEDGETAAIPDTLPEALRTAYLPIEVGTRATELPEAELDAPRATTEAAPKPEPLDETEPAAPPLEAESQAAEVDADTTDEIIEAIDPFEPGAVATERGSVPKGDVPATEAAANGGQELDPLAAVDSLGSKEAPGPDTDGAATREESHGPVETDWIGEEQSGGPDDDAGLGEDQGGVSNRAGLEVLPLEKEPDNPPIEPAVWDTPEILESEQNRIAPGELIPPENDTGLDSGTSVLAAAEAENSPATSFQPGDVEEPASDDLPSHEPPAAGSTGTDLEEAVFPPEPANLDRAEEDESQLAEEVGDGETGLGDQLGEPNGVTPGAEALDGPTDLGEELDESEEERLLQPGDGEEPVSDDLPSHEPPAAGGTDTDLEEAVFPPEPADLDRAEEDESQLAEEARDGETGPGDQLGEAEGVTPGAEEPDGPTDLGEELDESEMERLLQPGDGEEPVSDDLQAGAIPATDDRSGDAGDESYPLETHVSSEPDDRSELIMGGTATESPDIRDDRSLRGGDAERPDEAEETGEQEAAGVDQAIDASFQPGSTAVDEQEESPEIEAGTAEISGGEAGEEQYPMGEEPQADDEDQERTTFDESAQELAEQPVVQAESPDGPADSTESAKADAPTHFVESENDLTSSFQPGDEESGTDATSGMRGEEDSTTDSAGEVEPFEPGEGSETVESQDEEGSLDEADKGLIAKAEPLPGDEVVTSEGTGPHGDSQVKTHLPSESDAAFEPGDQPEAVQISEKEILEGNRTEGQETADIAPTEMGAAEMDRVHTGEVPEDSPKEEDRADGAIPGDQFETPKLTGTEDESISALRAGETDLGREPFEPGDALPATELEVPEAETESTPDQVTPTGEEPYRPDVVSLEKEATQDSDDLDKAAHASGDMPGEWFEPVGSRPAKSTGEELEPAADATESAREEEPATETAGVDEKLQIDPKLATFTLVTIYKVQGLYQQALQVLDMLEAKDSDPERIQAERDSVHQLMLADSRSE